jgi:hypothetical protein
LIYEPYALVHQWGNPGNEPLIFLAFNINPEGVAAVLPTAAAASLALIPIAREIFWGPMAYAMMGGIIVGTMLTLLFLPALYVAWFRIKEPVSAADDTPENPLAPDLQADISADQLPISTLPAV